MIKRIIEISQAKTYLSVKYGQLIIRQDGEQVSSIPCEDIGVLLVDHQGVTYTHSVFTELLRCGAAVVLCGWAGEYWFAWDMIISGYRAVWIFTMFDLPTDTKKARKDYTYFRKNLLKNGFSMLQYSVYVRHCASEENADVHYKRIKQNLPPDGEVRLITITDKQFGRMETFWGKMRKPTSPAALIVTDPRLSASHNWVSGLSARSFIVTDPRLSANHNYGGSVTQITGIVTDPRLSASHNPLRLLLRL